MWSEQGGSTGSVWDTLAVWDPHLYDVHDSLTRAVAREITWDQVWQNKNFFF